MATIKITQLQNIGANLTANTLLPVVDTTGLAVTDKVTVGNVANYILTEAGNLLPEAFVSQIAYSVANAAQPNITSVGNLSVNTLHITGGTNGQYLQTDGTGNLAWVSGGGSGNGTVGGSNTQIQFNNQGSFGGSSSLTWDSDHNKLNTSNLSVSGNANVGNVNTVNVNATGNLRPNAIYTDHYYYANGYVFGGGGGNGTPGGSNTQIQFNDNGSFNGNTGFTFNKTTGIFSSPFLAGNGNGLSNIQGANVSGAVGLATYAGTANAVAGANVSGAVSFAGTANSVAVANVVGLGNISTIALNGNGSTFLRGNGTWGNAGTGTGDLNFTANAMYNFGGVIVENADLTHGATSALVIPPNGNTTNPAQLNNFYGNIGLQAGVDPDHLKNWTFDKTGNLTLPGVLIAQANDNGSILFSNDGTTDRGSLKVDGGYNMVMSASSNFYVKRAGSDRLAITDTNTSLMASSNTVIQSNKTGSAYTWTFGNDGTFNLPDSVSTGNAIVQSVSNIQINVDGDIWSFGLDGNLTLPTNSSSINYANGQPYGGGGSANTGNVTFNGNVVQGTASYTGLGLSASPDDTANLKYLQVRAGDIDSHIHFDTGNYQAYDQYFGDDNKYLKLEKGLAGNVLIGTFQDGGIGQLHWTFDSNGNLTLPENGRIKAAGNVLPFNTTITDMTSGSTTVVVTTTDNIFPGEYSGQVTISNVNAPAQSNGTWWYLAVDSNKFQLYYDQALSLPVDGTSWPGYAGGGDAVSVGSAMAIIASNVTIDTGLGNSWTFDTNGDISFPQGSGSFTKGRIQSANGYPTLLGYGSAPEHGGPELDWINGDNPNDLGNTSVLRNTLFINDLGLYVGMNENHVDVANNFSGSWRFGSSGSLTIPAGNANNINSGQIFSDNESSFINLDVQFNSNVLGGMRLGTGATKPVDIVTGNGSGYNTWRFDSNGEIATPDGTLIGAVEGPGTFGFYNSNATNFLIEGPNNITWSFNTGTGETTLPTISLGSGVDEQTVIQSQRKIIPPNRYSAVITGNTPTIVYTAKQNSITIKTTLVVEHIGFGFEMFDVSAVGAGANVIYSVSNRLNGTGQADTTVSVDWNSNQLAITLTVNSGATTSYVTYDSTEFGIAVD